jgi:hypothetical protein
MVDAGLVPYTRDLRLMEEHACPMLVQLAHSAIISPTLVGVLVARITQFLCLLLPTAPLSFELTPVPVDHHAVEARGQSKQMAPVRLAQQVRDLRLGTVEGLV